MARCSISNLAYPIGFVGCIILISIPIIFISMLVSSNNSMSYLNEIRNNGKLECTGLDYYVRGKLIIFGIINDLNKGFISISFPAKNEYLRSKYDEIKANNGTFDCYKKYDFNDIENNPLKQVYMDSYIDAEYDSYNSIFIFSLICCIANFIGYCFMFYKWFHWEE